MGKKGETVLSIPRGISKIIGLMVGYIFSSEVVSGLTFIFGYSREQLPTLFDLLSNYDSTVATILLALLIIFLIGIISKFQLLSFSTWLLYGALLGIIIPIISPYILDRLEVSGYQIPQFLKNFLGDGSNGNVNNSTII